MVVLVGAAVANYSSSKATGKVWLLAAIIFETVAVFSTKNCLPFEGFPKIGMATAFLQFVPVRRSLLPLMPSGLCSIKWSTGDHVGRTYSDIPILYDRQLFPPYDKFNGHIRDVYHGSLPCKLRLSESTEVAGSAS